MSPAQPPSETAKRPKQKRAQERIERVLEEAERVLSAEGIEGFSIPVLAERLGFTRGSLYSYFPTPEALLTEVAQRHLAKMLRGFARHKELAGLPWRRGIEIGVGIACDYYDKHRVARHVILAGAVTDQSVRAQARMIKRLAALGRAAWQARGIRLPAEEPDVAALAIDLGVACLRRSVFESDRITSPYRDAAAQVMISFLERHVEAAR